MPKSFDHIIKNILENYVAPHASDWEVFYDLLAIEQGDLADQNQLDEEEFGEALANLEYAATTSGWEAFEDRLDNLNAELDVEFDQTVGEALENIPESTWGTAHWHSMSSRLDDLEIELDKEFDQTIGGALENIPEAAMGAAHWNVMSSRLDDLDIEMDQEFDQALVGALGNLPDATWKEKHWQMLSSRLDELNDQPRLLMMKMIEAAAILLILFQVTSLYNDFQRNNGGNHTVTSYFDRIFKSEHIPGKDLIVPPNSFPSDLELEREVIAGKSVERNVKKESQIDLNKEINIQESKRTELEFIDQQKQDHAALMETESYRGNPSVIMPLPPLDKNPVQYNYLPEEKKTILEDIGGSDLLLPPQLSNTPSLIAYDYTTDRLMKTSPRLDVRDISLITMTASDSILNSIPTLQVIKPRLYSSMEVGMLADATNVEIQDSWLNVPRQPYQETILNAGLYFRYKIQFKNMFGSIGGDYLQLRYGSNSKNELSMLSLPMELGYNVINQSTFRMYFSGGVAGRFVPVANYRSETLNLSSGYNRTSKVASNGLLYNGPFEINSYLSGRLSMGLDINVSETTSVNLRYTHDFWLKGRGIGYNLDKMRSSHIAIGANHHF